MRKRLSYAVDLQLAQKARRVMGLEVAAQRGDQGAVRVANHLLVPDTLSPNDATINHHVLGLVKGNGRQERLQQLSPGPPLLVPIVASGWRQHYVWIARLVAEHGQLQKFSAYTANQRVPYTVGLTRQSRLWSRQECRSEKTALQWRNPIAAIGDGQALEPFVHQQVGFAIGNHIVNSINLRGHPAHPVALMRDTVPWHRHRLYRHGILPNWRRQCPGRECQTAGRLPSWH